MKTFINTILIFIAIIITCACGNRSHEVDVKLNELEGMVVTAESFADSSNYQKAFETLEAIIAKEDTLKGHSLYHPLIWNKEQKEKLTDLFTKTERLIEQMKEGNNSNNE